MHIVGRTLFFIIIIIQYTPGYAINELKCHCISVNIINNIINGYQIVNSASPKFLLWLSSGQKSP